MVRRTQQPLSLYRVSNAASPKGNYWTGVRPTGPAQSQIDFALRPDWGNRVSPTRLRAWHGSPSGYRIWRLLDEIGTVLRPARR